MNEVRILRISHFKKAFRVIWERFQCVVVFHITPVFLDSLSLIVLLSRGWGCLSVVCTLFWISRTPSGFHKVKAIKKKRSKQFYNNGKMLLDFLAVDKMCQRWKDPLHNSLSWHFPVTHGGCSQKPCMGKRSVQSAS